VGVISIFTKTTSVIEGGWGCVTKWRPRMW